MGSLLTGVSRGFDGLGGGSEVERYWLDWSDWSSCDHTCGHGLKVRTRNCYGGYPTEPGCQGASVESNGFLLRVKESWKYFKTIFFTFYNSSGSYTSAYENSQVNSADFLSISEFITLYIIYKNIINRNRDLELNTRLT